MHTKVYCNNQRLAILSAVATVLVAGIVIVLFWQGMPVARFDGSLRDVLPSGSNLSGWTVADAPIADTPEMQRKVDAMLNYDDAVYRIYEKEGQRISIYVAYWRPGKMPIRSVANHTPDVCWTRAGWQCTMVEVIKELPFSKGTIRNIEHRSFKFHGHTEHVIFRHIAGAKAVSYGTGGLPPWHAALTDFVRWGNQQTQEQFFLRISSNQTLDKFWRSDVVQELLARFPVLGD